MNLPLPGELKQRVTFELLRHVPDIKLGFSPETKASFTIWGRIEPVGGVVYWGSVQVESSVTHRIFVRAITGKTRPQDLPKVVEITCEGMRYVSKRITDINGAHRFTLIEAELKGVDNAFKRSSA